MEFTKEDVIYYIQERMLEDDNTEIENNVLTDLLWFNTYDKKEMKHVYNRMIEYGY